MFLRQSFLLHIIFKIFPKFCRELNLPPLSTCVCVVAKYEKSFYYNWNKKVVNYQCLETLKIKNVVLESKCKLVLCSCRVIHIFLTTRSQGHIRRMLKYFEQCFYSKMIPFQRLSLFYLLLNNSAEKSSWNVYSIGVLWGHCF